MAININENGKVEVKVVIKTELTAEQVVTAVALHTKDHPSMGTGKFARGSDDWLKKGQIIDLIDDAVEHEKLGKDIDPLDDLTPEDYEDALKRAKNVIMRGYPDLLMED